MDCAYFRAGVCHSCPLIETPYGAQVADKEASARALIGEDGVGGPTLAPEWEPTAASPEADFRIKAKMAVAGTVGAPTLGILDREYRGVDLQGCPIMHPAIRQAMPAVSHFITANRLEPYDVATKRGELKHVLVTVGEDDALMMRFVLRSRRLASTIQRGLPALEAELPNLAVAGINLQPVHTSIIEGPEEIPLTERRRLPIAISDDVTLLLGERSFVQTNTRIARELYKTVGRWAAGTGARTLWDLYCGVGGFALTAASQGLAVTGVEVSEDAISCATEAAALNGLGNARFLADDATEWARAGEDATGPLPDMVVVNPPRRGIGPDLAGFLETRGPRWVAYSSCYPDSQRADLDRMPSYRPVKARLFDMFPHTRHSEVAVLLERD